MATTIFSKTLENPNTESRSNIFNPSLEKLGTRIYHDIKTADRCFENVAQFRYLGTTITNQNFIQNEIKKRE
jgi:hypothetical protein